MSNWPFPPPGGPIPWTPQQEAAYQQEQRKRADEERHQMEEAPW